MIAVMGEGCKGGLPRNAAPCWIGNVRGKDAAVDRHCRPTLNEIVQDVVPFIAADAGRPGLAEQLSVHRDGRYRLGARESGLVILYSDGLTTSWTLGRYPNLNVFHPTLIAAVLYRDFARRRDDATVLVGKWPPLS